MDEQATIELLEHLLDAPQDCLYLEGRLFDANEQSVGSLGRCFTFEVESSERFQVRTNKSKDISPLISRAHQSSVTEGFSIYSRHINQSVFQWDLGPEETPKLMQVFLAQNWYLGFRVDDITSKLSSKDMKKAYIRNYL